jgi:phosphate acetyltransferase
MSATQISSQLMSRARPLFSSVDQKPLKRILLSEGQDNRVQEAASQIAQLGFARVSLLCSEAIKPIPGVEIIPLHEHPKAHTGAKELCQRRAHKGMQLAEAQSLLKTPLFLAATLLQSNAYDAVISGAVHTTADVLKAGMYCLDKAAGTSTISSFFLMCFSNRPPLTYADCGVVPAPSASELAEIALGAAYAHEKLTGESPRVAFLSFSTHGSAAHERVISVKEALSIFRSKAPTILADGELQFDAAFVPEIAARKCPTSSLNGNANVFIFPDLNSGNIAYKITERLAGATALGPIVQGFAKPWLDLSRGCSSEDIVKVAAIAALLS